MLDTARSKITKPRTTKSKTQKTSSKTSAVPAISSQLPEAPSRPKRTKTKPANESTLPPTTTKTMSQPTTTTITTTTAPSSEPTPLPPLRDLASSTPSLRRAALNTLATHLDSLPPHASLQPTQAQQLWRALYVALYMHDSKSAVSVQNLARLLAGLGRGMWEKDVALLGQGEGVEKWTWSSVWVEAFWGEMAREWVGVDQWRMNKVLMLVRMVVAEGVALVRETRGLEAGGGEKGEGKGVGADVDDDSWRDYVAEVVALPLEVQRELPDGLRMHVLDVWGDELEKLVGEDGEGEKEEEVANMLVQAAKELSVFRQGEANVPKNVRNRAREVVQKYGA